MEKLKRNGRTNGYSGGDEGGVSNPREKRVVTLNIESIKQRREGGKREVKGGKKKKEEGGFENPEFLDPSSSHRP